MAAATGKKSTTSLSLFMEVEEELHHGHSVLGRWNMDRKMAARTKISMAESVSRGSDVEAGERACRSSDVRDP